MTGSVPAGVYEISVQGFTRIGRNDGNTKGVGLLVEGMYAEDVIKKLRGVTCGYKRTSCPDQLAQALEKELHKNQSAL